MLPSVVQYRRALHRIPEIEDRLPKTTAYVLSILDPQTLPGVGVVTVQFSGSSIERT